ncbi:MAG: metal ABC transporter ATP-binding protein [Candidatus Omnitrophica bacterium]|jgi:zinc transport system ATP-binding protein|nr:metal ABC transporter ATP-binding protein [Candidatus Omnitrophota bacterium]
MIEVKNLSVKYQNIEALSSVNFKVEAGDYIGIVGPNGSGKTTLVKALLGLVSFEGKIVFQGESLSRFTLHKHIGYLPQKMSFLDQRFPATAKEIVVSGVYCCKKFPKRLTKEDYAAAEAIMKTLKITSLKDRPIGKLSGGQQQRVLLARSLVHSPSVLILDEPTIALDPQSRETFYETVQKLNKEKHVTVLLVSHDIASVGKYASKLLYLDRQVIFYGTFEEFCKSPRMSEYFGVSQHLICHRH